MADESVLQEIAWSDVVRPVLAARLDRLSYIEESGRAVPTITKLVSVDKLLPLYNHKLGFSVFADFCRCIITNSVSLCSRTFDVVYNDKRSFSVFVDNHNRMQFVSVDKLLPFCNDKLSFLC